MKGPLEELPIPGIVLGGYPERRKLPDANRDSLAQRVRGMVAPFRRRADWDAFTWETQARREVLESLSDASFSHIVLVTRKLLFSEGFEDGLLTEAMACACEAARRALGVVPFNTQLIAARLMLDNQLAEMETGEGKTLATALTAAVAAMAGIPVHCVTANDYLVTRDAELMQSLYRMLGLTASTVTQKDDPAARRRAYACDITYCTAKELVFDYLKDGLQLGRAKHDLLHRVQVLSQQETGWQQPFLRGLCMAIVDEADSVLIDEAGTPLIVARMRQIPNEANDLLQALRIAKNLRAERHYRLAGDHAEITDQARGLLAKLASDRTGAWRDPRRREELIVHALSALHVYQRDRHYVIQDGKICIIDQITGRLAEGRAWSRGLHQLIELKEGCEVTGPQVPIAQITFQRFFPRYLRLTGTSGTLIEARRELKADYKLGVRRVPLRRSSQRRYLGIELYATQDKKWRRVIERVREMHALGRPQLIGTDSVADSEQLSQLLHAKGLIHQVLNARQDREEANIVASAGETGAITVATNMAGRGTDIALGAGVVELGGLHVISCQLNSEARIDRQLYGRSGRQGDPGSVETILSLEEPLFRRWVPGWVRHTIAPLLGAERALPNWIAARVVRLAQSLEVLARRTQRRNLIRRDALDERRLSISGAGE